MFVKENTIYYAVSPAEYDRLREIGSEISRLNREYNQIVNRMRRVEVPVKKPRFFCFVSNFLARVF